MQDITHYVFNPAVSTLNRIDESSISTLFYSLDGIGFDRSEEILIAALLGEVYSESLSLHTECGICKYVIWNSV